MFIIFIDPYARIVVKGSYSTENHAEMTDQMTWEPTIRVYETTANAQDSHLLQFSEMPTSERILQSSTTRADYGDEYSEASERTTTDYMTALPDASSEVSSGKFHITQAIIDRVTHMHREADTATEYESTETSEMIYNDETTESQEGCNI